MSIDKKLSQLIINKLTQQQFDTITPSDDELYLVEETATYATVEELATKQDVISDLATIRDGASKGATAYQKPSTGIPKTDLASAVQTSLGKADTAIQSTADCVKTSGNQTVAGVKTFSSTPVITSTALNINNDTASIQKKGVNFLRKNANGAVIISSDGTDKQIILRPNGDTNVTGAVTITSDGNVTATKFTGALYGNASTATKATQDENGNNIVNTYATKTYANTASFPSKTKVGYGVGASGAFYTASDNGWLYINGSCTGAPAYVLLANTTRGISNICWNNASAGNALACYIPVNQGDTFQISYYQYSPQQCWITKINGEV